MYFYPNILFWLEALFVYLVNFNVNYTMSRICFMTFISISTCMCNITNIIGFAKYFHAVKELKFNSIYFPYFLSETLYHNKWQIFTLEQQLHITYLTRETYLCKTVTVEFSNWNQTSNNICISKYFVSDYVFDI